MVCCCFKIIVALRLHFFKTITTLRMDGVRASVGLGLCLAVIRAEPAEILDLRPVVSMFFTYS